MERKPTYGQVLAPYMAVIANEMAPILEKVGFDPDLIFPDRFWVDDDYVDFYTYNSGVWVEGEPALVIEVKLRAAEQTSRLPSMD